MPCFWTGFIGSREPGCSGDTPPPDPCDGIAGPPASIDIWGDSSICPGQNFWEPAPGELPTGYAVDSGLGCTDYDETPTTVVLIRTCDAQTFVVNVGAADIVCC
jgi:hypothetical protein